MTSDDGSFSGLTSLTQFWDKWTDNPSTTEDAPRCRRRLSERESRVERVRDLVAAAPHVSKRLRRIGGSPPKRSKASSDQASRRAYRPNNHDMNFSPLLASHPSRLRRLLRRPRRSDLDRSRGCNYLWHMTAVVRVQPRDGVLHGQPLVLARRRRRSQHDRLPPHVVCLHRLGHQLGHVVQGTKSRSFVRCVVPD